MDNNLPEPPIRLVVIVSDVGAAVNIGGNVETRAKTFEIPHEISQYIKNNRGKWTTISFAIED